MTTCSPTLECIAEDLATFHHWLAGHLAEGTSPTREDLQDRLEEVEEVQSDLEKAMPNLRAFLEATGAVLRTSQVCTLEPKAGIR